MLDTDLAAAARRAGEALRPPRRKQVRPARLFVRKAALKLDHRTRKVGTRHPMTVRPAPDGANRISMSSAIRAGRCCAPQSARRQSRRALVCRKRRVWVARAVVASPSPRACIRPLRTLRVRSGPGPPVQDQVETAAWRAVQAGGQRGRRRVGRRRIHADGDGEAATGRALTTLRSAARPKGRRLRRRPLREAETHPARRASALRAD